MVAIDTSSGVIIVVGVVGVVVVADAVSVGVSARVGVGIAAGAVPAFRGSWYARSVGSFSLGETPKSRQQGGNGG